MNSLPFTKIALDAITPTSKQFAVSDAQCSGLKLRVSPGGTKTFMVYRKVRGRPQRITIGCYPDVSIAIARKEAQRLNSMIALGKDPQAEKMQLRKEPTFRELSQRYYDEHAVRHTKRPRENWRMLEVHAFPAFGKVKCSEIGKERARQLYTKMADNSGKGGSNRVAQIISAVFNFGLKNEYFIGINPFQGLRKFKLSSRDRFLNHDELSAFFSALKHEKPLFQDYFMLALCTGARKGNVLSMKWSDLDIENRTWRISEEDSKNGNVNTVMLTTEAVNILALRRKERINASENNTRDLSPFVFPGIGRSGHLRCPKQSFDRIKKRMGVKDIRIHDLRRTLGSHMAMNGASLPIIGKALTHRDTGATAIYARLANDPVLNAMETATAKMLLSVRA